jgi:hypothetical protein
MREYQREIKGIGFVVLLTAAALLLLFTMEKVL